jgi:hypothetical protein
VTIPPLSSEGRGHRFESCRVRHSLSYLAKSFATSERPRKHIASTHAGYVHLDSALVTAADRVSSVLAVGKLRAAPRVAFVVMEDPEEPERRLFLHAKNNIALAPPGLAYRLEQVAVGEQNIAASRVEWETDSVSMTADEAVAASHKLPSSKRLSNSYKALWQRD